MTSSLKKKINKSGSLARKGRQALKAVSIAAPLTLLPMSTVHAQEADNGKGWLERTKERAVCFLGIDKPYCNEENSERRQEIGVPPADLLVTRNDGRDTIYDTEREFNRENPITLETREGDRLRVTFDDTTYVQRMKERGLVVDRFNQRTRKPRPLDAYIKEDLDEGENCIVVENPEGPTIESGYCGLHIHVEDRAAEREEEREPERREEPQERRKEEPSQPEEPQRPRTPGETTEREQRERNTIERRREAEERVKDHEGIHTLALLSYAWGDGFINPANKGDPPLRFDGFGADVRVSGDDFYLRGDFDGFGIKFDNQAPRSVFESSTDDANLTSILVEGYYFPISSGVVSLGLGGGFEDYGITSAPLSGTASPRSVIINEGKRGRLSAILRVGDGDDHVQLIGSYGIEQSSNLDESLSGSIYHAGLRAMLTGDRVGLVADADAYLRNSSDEIDTLEGSLQAKGGYLISAEAGPQIYLSDNVGMFGMLGFRKSKMDFDRVDSDGNLIGETTGESRWGDPLYFKAGITIDDFFNF